MPAPGQGADQVVSGMVETRKREMTGGKAMVYDANLGFTVVHGEDKKTIKDRKIKVFLADNPADQSECPFSSHNTWEELQQTVKERLLLPPTTRIKLGTRLGHMFAFMGHITDGMEVCVTVVTAGGHKGRTMKEAKEYDAMVNSNRPPSAGWKRQPEGVTAEQLRDAPVVDVRHLSGPKKWLNKYGMLRHEWFHLLLLSYELESI